MNRIKTTSFDKPRARTAGDLTGTLKDVNTSPCNSFGYSNSEKSNSNSEKDDTFTFDHVGDSEGAGAMVRVVNPMLKEK